MRSPRILTITLATASLLAVSGVAFAVVQSVGTSPDPQTVIPTSTVHTATPRPSDDHGGAARTSDDNPATHDVGDDHGGTTSSRGGSGADDHGSGADDHGSGGHGSDG